MSFFKNDFEEDEGTFSILQRDAEEKVRQEFQDKISELEEQVRASNVQRVELEKQLKKLKEEIPPKDDDDDDDEAPPPPPPPLEELDKLQEQIDTLRKEKESLDTRLADAVAQQKRQEQDFQDRIKKLQEAAEAARSQSSESLAKLRQEKEKTKTLEKRLESVFNALEEFGNRAQGAPSGDQFFAGVTSMLFDDEWYKIDTEGDRKPFQDLAAKLRDLIDRKTADASADVLNILALSAKSAKTRQAFDDMVAREVDEDNRQRLQVVIDVLSQLIDERMQGKRVERDQKGWAKRVEKAMKDILGNVQEINTVFSR